MSLDIPPICPFTIGNHLLYLKGYYRINLRRSIGRYRNLH